MLIIHWEERLPYCEIFCCFCKKFQTSILSVMQSIQMPKQQKQKQYPSAGFPWWKMNNLGLKVENVFGQANEIFHFPWFLEHDNQSFLAEENLFDKRSGCLTKRENIFLGEQKPGKLSLLRLRAKILAPQLHLKLKLCLLEMAPSSQSICSMGQNDCHLKIVQIVFQL